MVEAHELFITKWDVISILYFGRHIQTLLAQLFWFYITLTSVSLSIQTVSISILFTSIYFHFRTFNTPNSMKTQLMHYSYTKSWFFPHRNDGVNKTFMDYSFSTYLPSCMRNVEHCTAYIELRLKKTLLFALLSVMNASCSCSQWVCQGFLYIEHSSNSFRFQLRKVKWWRILTVETLLLKVKTMISTSPTAKIFSSKKFRQNEFTLHRSYTGMSKPSPTSSKKMDWLLTLNGASNCTTDSIHISRE